MNFTKVSIVTALFLSIPHVMAGGQETHGGDVILEFKTTAEAQKIRDRILRNRTLRDQTVPRNQRLDPLFDVDISSLKVTQYDIYLAELPTLEPSKIRTLIQPKTSDAKKIIEERLEVFRKNCYFLYHFLYWAFRDSDAPIWVGVKGVVEIDDEGERLLLGPNEVHVQMAIQETGYQKIYYDTRLYDQMRKSSPLNQPALKFHELIQPYNEEKDSRSVQDLVALLFSEESNKPNNYSYAQQIIKIFPYFRNKFQLSGYIHDFVIYQNKENYKEYYLSSGKINKYFEIQAGEQLLGYRNYPSKHVKADGSLEINELHARKMCNPSEKIFRGYSFRCAYMQQNEVYKPVAIIPTNDLNDNVMIGKFEFAPDTLLEFDSVTEAPLSVTGRILNTVTVGNITICKGSTVTVRPDGVLLKTDTVCNMRDRNIKQKNLVGAPPIKCENPRLSIPVDPSDIVGKMNRCTLRDQPYLGLTLSGVFSVGNDGKMDILTDLNQNINSIAVNTFTSKDWLEGSTRLIETDDGNLEFSFISKDYIVIDVDGFRDFSCKPNEKIAFYPFGKLKKCFLSYHYIFQPKEIKKIYKMNAHSLDRPYFHTNNSHSEHRDYIADKKYPYVAIKENRSTEFFENGQVKKVKVEHCYRKARRNERGAVRARRCMIGNFYIRHGSDVSFDENGAVTSVTF